MSESTANAEFDAANSLVEFTCNAASYFFAWQDYIHLLCDDIKSLDEFYETATIEEKEKLDAAGKIINDFEMAVSKLQGKLLDLGIMKFDDDTET